MRETPVVSVVAFSGTGKTTMIEKLIPVLTSRGLRVAVIKHDAHDFEVDKKGKDSWRMTQAGAAVTAICSATKAAIMENRPVTMETVISRVYDVDLIITEGYKHGPWPKIALMREANGKPLPVPPEECIAIMSDVHIETETPQLSLEDVDALADIIIAEIGA